MISSQRVARAALFVCFGTLCCGGNASAANPASSPSATAANQPLPIQYPTDVLTYHYNVFRQGATLQETTLTPSNVNLNTFGKINFFTVDGRVDAQPLFVNKQSIGGGLNDTVYVVTENDSAFAFSANSGRQFWQVSALLPGESPSDDRGCDSISPEIGITDTPVID